MKTPTQKEIDTEIETLMGMKPHVVPRSGFGDDNHAAIDAQIAVLKDDIIEDGIDGINDRLDREDWCQYEADSALEAREWLEGLTEVAPSKNWQPLVKGGAK